MDYAPLIYPASIGTIGKHFKHPLHRVEYVIRSRGIRACTKVGNANAYDVEAVRQIGDVLAEICRRASAEGDRPTSPVTSVAIGSDDAIRGNYLRPSIREFVEQLLRRAPSKSAPSQDRYRFRDGTKSLLSPLCDSCEEFDAAMKLVTEGLAL